MKRMTEAEANRLDELHTETTPEIDPVKKRITFSSKRSSNIYG